MKKPVLGVIVSLITILVTASNTFAVSSLRDVTDPFIRFDSLGEIASKLLPFIFGFAAMLALLFIIWGGLRYMMARGDPKQVDSARRTITSAIIGLVVIISVAVIFSIINQVLRINVFGLIAPPVYAQTEGVDIGCTVKLGTSCIKDVFPNVGALFTAIINIALAAGGLIFFAMLVWGGIRYMLSRGDDKLIVEARQTITNAMIGLLIIITSFAIIKLIASATRANISIF